MFLKFLATAVVLIVAWTVATRLTGPGRRRSSRRVNDGDNKSPLQKLVKCPGCGIYLPAGQTCSCADRQ
jgi:hypothetical protein